MNIKTICYYAVMAVMLVSSVSCTATKKKPNVVVFLVDDAGYVDFGFMGSEEMKTPNIDKIASNGAFLTDFHVTGSVCGPSRAGLMTGRYQHRFGAEFNNHPDGIGVPKSEKMIAEMMHEEGYKTAAFGKWHLGHDETCHPNNRGYDEFYGFISGHRSYFPNPKYDKPGDKAMQYNGEYVKYDGYLTDVLGDKAADFIKENKDNPFFIYLAYNAVHTPMEATEEDLSMFEGHPRQMLAAMTWALDRSVGNVMNTLKEQNILDNTLVVFFSDNGGPTNSNTSSNGPLKGVKGTEFEGGHRVSCAMMWEGQIVSGTKFDKLASSLDLYPTLKAAAGITKEDLNPLDGVSLIPYLKGEKVDAPHHKLYWRINPWSAARHGNMKLVDADTITQGLYNLDVDLGEMNNLRNANPEKVNELYNSLQEWESEMPKARGNSEGAWEKVKGYMYEDYINNDSIRYYSPWDLKKEKQNKKK